MLGVVMSPFIPTAKIYLCQFAGIRFAKWYPPEMNMNHERRSGRVIYIHLETQRNRHIISKSGELLPHRKSLYWPCPSTNTSKTNAAKTSANSTPPPHATSAGVTRGTRPVSPVSSTPPLHRRDTKSTSLTWLL